MSLLQAVEQLEKELSEANERADKAEAMLKAVSEQEPVAYIDKDGYKWSSTTSMDKERWGMRPLYAAPIPPADVQALLERIDKLERNEVLYRADIERVLTFMPELKNTDDYFEVHEAVQHRIEELNTLLSKARDEGYQLGRKQQRESDAKAGSIICYETHHATLGDSVEAAILTNTGELK